ncbi:hypothetical protein [Reyranella sp. CPCC 100927]|uniref:hypothetical protein n=1 Tax=Reyranella sp. CPCC 100927 TaxID=2599616 RepID=UPI0011B554DB|nr:hypothetical protein [Reyranella sp. CPCC 100927]TWT01696.1 hypothetical protein FQU96_31925 [Reyranella sp. CPCC 100927]
MPSTETGPRHERRPTCRRRTLGGALLATLLGMSLPSAAAPLPPAGPVNLCGTIVSAKWQAAQTARGIPGMSGTAGHDRTFPAQFTILLEAVSGADAATARNINLAFGLSDKDAHETPAGPRRVRLGLNHDDPNFLDGAGSLCIDGYSVRGDEGGTWTEHKSVAVKRR